MPFGEVPRGLEDLKAAVLNSSDVAGASVDVSGAQSLTFTVDSDSDEVQGDDTVIATVRGAKSLSGSIGIARINLTAIAALVGGTAGTSGVTPNIILTLNESDAAVSRWCQLTGQANSYDASGSAYRVLLKKIAITAGPSETLDQETFDTPTMDFSGVGIAGVLLTRSNYETKVALT
jgi:hypothetical protein